MKRKLAIVICCVLLVSVLIRIGVGGMMIGQAAVWWTFDGEAAESLADTQRFLSEQKSNIVGFAPMAYFAFILFMGFKTVGLGTDRDIPAQPRGVVRQFYAAAGQQGDECKQHSRRILSCFDGLGAYCLWCLTYLFWCDVYFSGTVLAK